MSSLIIFSLLIALMLTGMPISIALGMTVLTFIFTMTNVPTESVALRCPPAATPRSRRPPRGSRRGAVAHQS